MVREFVTAVTLALGALAVACGTFKTEHPAPTWANDADHDSVEDSKDQCKNEPEDYDGYKDGDGCPDKDNDGDTVADVDDQCPNVKGETPHGCPGIKEARELAQLTAADFDKDGDGVMRGKDKCEDQPEDMDGYQDDDGCPEEDTDSDHDGIPDRLDQCNGAREDGRSPKPKDGCPDPDSDGVVGAADRCPTQYGRTADGCPPDTDGDGIRDPDDKCPRDPEDKDGFQDSDGCPDLDNDRDGIPDKQDRCPNEPENLNLVKDDDGCPD